MAVKVGINGFGRIGRNIFRTALGDADIDFVAVNDITDTKTLAHLLKYDSVLGNLEHGISASENGISVEGNEIRVFSERDPSAIPWESVGAEIVIESRAHLTAKRKHGTMLVTTRQRCCPPHGMRFAFCGLRRHSATTVSTDGHKCSEGDLKHEIAYR